MPSDCMKPELLQTNLVLYRHIFPSASAFLLEAYVAEIVFFEAANTTTSKTSFPPERELRSELLQCVSLTVVLILHPQMNQRLYIYLSSGAAIIMNSQSLDLDAQNCKSIHEVKLW